MNRFFLVLLVLVTVISCATEDEISRIFEVGDDFLESNARVVRVDTFRVSMATIKFDSINSSDTDRILVGRYIDQQMGVVTASSYLQMDSFLYNIPDEAELDSVALILGYDHYSYGDTLAVSTIHVHRITERFEPEDAFFYNTSTLVFEETPMASVTYAPEPLEEDSLHISMNIPFFRDLFDAIQNGDIDDAPELYRTLRGITLQPGKDDNGAVIGFTENSQHTYIRFFYTIPGETEDIEENFDLSLLSTAVSPNLFNNIKGEVSGLPLEILTDQEVELNAEDIDYKTYIQAGVGYATKVQFPSIKKIVELPGEGAILNATLQLRPTGFTNALFITDSLDISILDANNLITEPQIFNGQGQIFVNLREGDVEFDEEMYEVTIATYLDRKINEVENINDGLVIYHKDFNKRVDRLIIDTAPQPVFETQLIINYVIYEEQ